MRRKIISYGGGNTFAMNMIDLALHEATKTAFELGEALRNLNRPPRNMPAIRLFNTVVWKKHNPTVGYIIRGSANRIEKRTGFNYGPAGLVFFGKPLNDHYSMDFGQDDHMVKSIVSLKDGEITIDPVDEQESGIDQLPLDALVECFGFTTRQQVDPAGNISTEVVELGTEPGQVCHRGGCDGVILSSNEDWISHAKRPFPLNTNDFNLCPVCGWNNEPI